MPAGPEKFSKRHAQIVIALALTALFLVLLPSYWTDFFLLDDGALTEAPSFNERHLLDKITGIFIPGRHVDYYPVRDLSALVDRQICGPLNAGCHRLQSWLLFAVLIFLFHRVALLAGHLPTAALILTLAFLAHPLQVEFLLWLSARKDLLALIFALALTSLWLRQRAGEGAPKRWTLTTLLLLSKANYVFFPFVGEAVWRKSAPGRRVLLSLTVTLALCAGLGWLHWNHYRQTTPVVFERNLSEKISLGLINIGKYATALAGFPDFRFSFDFGPAWVEAHFFPRILGLVVFLAGAYWLWRGRTSWPWILTALFLPVSGLLSGHLVVFASRYAAPLLPFALLALPTKRKTVLIAVVAWSALLLLPSLHSQITLWSEPQALWEEHLRLSPDHLESRLNALQENRRIWLEHHTDEKASALMNKHLSELERRCPLDEATASLPLPCYYFRLSRLQSEKDPEFRLLTRLEALETTAGKLRPADQAHLARFHAKKMILLRRLRGERPPLEISDEFLGVEGLASANSLNWQTRCLAKGPENAKAYLEELRSRNLLAVATFRRAFVSLQRTHPESLAHEIKSCALPELGLK